MPRTSLGRLVKVTAICGAALALAVPPASATVTPGSAGGTQVYLDSDDDGDSMALSCTAGQVRYLAINLLACNVTQDIFIYGDGGNDSVDLTALQAGDFPVLTRVLITAGTGSDNIKGSFYGDTIEADGEDTIQGFGGDDEVTGGDSVFGGEGNDTLTQISGAIDGGNGDDLISQPFNGPINGGGGEDTIQLDYSSVTTPIPLNVVINDSVLHLDIPGTPQSVDVSATTVERYDWSMPRQGAHSWTSTAYSGSVDLRGFEGDEVVNAGPGEDFIDTGAGNDQVTAGAGFDYVKAGAGNDLVNVRDGATDRVICGDGSDTAVADASDVVTGCESVQLPAPPAPPAPVVPTTGAIKGPKTVDKGDKAKFTFSSPTAGATFQCKLDKGRWKACTSPHKVATKKLKASDDGIKHKLQVRAVVGGVVDATPSKKSFKVVS